MDVSFPIYPTLLQYRCDIIHMLIQISLIGCFAENVIGGVGDMFVGRMGGIKGRRGSSIDEVIPVKYCTGGAITYKGNVFSCRVL